jgi:hypothetical protein
MESPHQEATVMERQVYCKCPETGAYRHMYVDRGEAQVRRLRGTPTVPRDAKGNANFGRKVTGSGAA